MEVILLDLKTCEFEPDDGLPDLEFVFEVLVQLCAMRFNQLAFNEAGVAGVAVLQRHGLVLEVEFNQLRILLHNIVHVELHDLVLHDFVHVEQVPLFVHLEHPVERQILLFTQRILLADLPIDQN
eukprot:CAMPEP_0116892804 /NCGR_PEP_ID=MMETSP0467-20121206/2942_1 /TAXON_ID=283647 /ORGANISM="Mesodinium pulex, Strain SPMC105" /LENGTH=124 /DNA_ID=CAMNT_0004562129 /DNA_START=526 /DNA_END=900 /DNA_ORIENTATION=+